MMIAIAIFGEGTTATSSAATSVTSIALGYQVAFGISAVAALVVLVCVVTKIKD
jgi:hypothetical protein